MRVICLHDKDRIEAFLRKNVYLHIYSIGDLDDFLWHKTVWYALEDRSEIRAIVLLYAELPRATLHAMCEQQDFMVELLRTIFGILPHRFHAHLSPDVAEVFEKQCRIDSYAKYYRMALNRESLPYGIDCSQVVRLTQNDLDEMLRLYEEAYPGNWFNPTMLQTGQYFGVRMKNRLVSAGGVHIYSEKYKVAALGNIATHPDFRGKGFGKSVIARLCQSLLEKADHIGLNVKADNAVAISLYEKLGFEIACSYYECNVTNDP